mmetsp:Transcript_56172/g.154882  ORF Transcript_56172/g.154882 Transcript_56172/m.154882 type:complete len:424 (+) Transcript_56172:198-1469(+)
MALRMMPLKRQAASMAVRSMSTGGWMSELPMGPPDALFGLIDAFNKDPAEKKISLGIGAYRDDNNKPHVLPSVRKAEKVVLDNMMNHEYAGIAGVPDFVEKSLEFAYGEASTPLAEGRVAAVQAISGTGALRIGANLFAKFAGAGTPFYLPAPSWGNHTPIFGHAGLEVKQYTYYDPNTCGLDFTGMLDDLMAAPEGSMFLLHACAHNPTGVDPTEEQWREISDVMKKKSHAIFFDCAYQGFASGDAEKDAFAVRHFVEEGHNILLAQSYSKNFGLYGERVGALSAVLSTAEEAAKVESQMKILVRPMYSNPPVYGARLVSTILRDPALKAEWAGECLEMAERINTVRSLLVDNLESAGSIRPWGHITDQIGMFCYSGLTKAEVEAIRDKHSVYMTLDGRISMAGVTSGNVEYLAQAMHDVTK